MTYLQFKYYLNNEDLASISYRKFNKEEKDEYPTISICLKNDQGRIFKHAHEVFKSTNSTRKSYGRYLLGQLEDDPPQFSAIQFDEVVLDFYDGYLVRTQETGSLVPITSIFTTHAFAMVPSFRDPERVCVSKQIPYRKNNKQFVDVVHLNSTRLYDNELYVEIYVHQKGKLIRNLPSPTTTLPPDEKIKDGIKKIFDIGQVEILRKRENSKITCDQRITNEDEYLLEQLMINVGCIPTFWMSFGQRIGLNQTVRRCNGKNDYENIRDRLEDAKKGFLENESTYENPCTLMIISIRARDGTKMSRQGSTHLLSNLLGSTKLKVLNLQFRYYQDLYREIINYQAYTGETLLGQVGGFVGIQNQFIMLVKCFNVFILEYNNLK